MKLNATARIVAGRLEKLSVAKLAQELTKRFSMHVTREQKSKPPKNLELGDVGNHLLCILASDEFDEKELIAFLKKNGFTRVFNNGSALIVSPPGNVLTQVAGLNVFPDKGVVQILGYEKPMMLNNARNKKKE